MEYAEIGPVCTDPPNPLSSLRTTRSLGSTKMRGFKFVLPQFRSKRLENESYDCCDSFGLIRIPVFSTSGYNLAEALLSPSNL